MSKRTQGVRFPLLLELNEIECTIYDTLLVRVCLIKMPVPNAAAKNTGNADVDLRNPFLAGILAWLVPGLGHLYQRRYPKALIFFLCIMPTFAIGCVLASGPEIGIARNVYWSWRAGDMRFWWLAQAPLGVAVIPSWTQAWQVDAGKQPTLGTFMSPPKLYPEDRQGIAPVLSELRRKTPHYELGTYLTVIAGLMNILVIFDAIGGPFLGRRKEKKKPN
ncbi:MAG: hypothetical protein FWG73_06120 [Planctomycetaceae bacterium]|nr:hypothetical protein [Planctomycetaceae bacterium]